MLLGIKQMSDFLQLPNNLFRILLLVVFVSLISFSSALELGVSPPFLYFDGEKGNVICNNISIFSNFDGLNLLLNDKWSDKDGDDREIRFYELEALDVGINREYDERVSVGK